MIPLPYNVISQPLDAAQTDKEFQIPGDSLEFNTDGTLTGVSVRIGNKKADAIPLDGFKALKFPVGFKEFYVTWSAQSGKMLYIYIGRDNCQVRRA